MTGAVPDTIEALVARVRAQPDDYAANRDLALRLSSTRKHVLHAAPYLVRAIASGRKDEHTMTLLDRLAMVLAIEGRIEEVEQTYATAMSVFPGVPDFFFRRADALFRLGRDEDAMALCRDATQALFRNARDASTRNGERLVHLLGPDKVICRYLGETAAKIDLYLKARALGLVETARAVLLAPEGEVVNRALLDHWALQAGIEVVADPRAAAEWRRSHAANWVYLDYYTLPDGRTLRRDLAHRTVQAMWEAAGRGPLLTLPPDHRAEGRALLSRLGLPERAWFVCLHVREPGFFDEDVEWSPNRHRNARIETYLPAIEEIVTRGGRVVRIGDPSMTPLPAMPGVIDYALSDIRRDWLDLVCVADSRFYLGMASGPSSVAVAFGVPTLGTNWFPLGHWPYCRGDIFIPKLMSRTGDGRVLSIAEALEVPLFGAMEPLFFEARGLAPLDNSPDEILAATREMLDALDGRAVYTAEDQRRQETFRRDADPYRVGLAPRVGRAFLDAHPELNGGAA